MAGLRPDTLCAMAGCAAVMALHKGSAPLLLIVCCTLSVAAAVGARLPAWTKTADGVLPMWPKQIMPHSRHTLVSTAASRPDHTDPRYV